MAADLGDAEFERLIEEAQAQPVSGWDFSWLGPRMVTKPLPWDYDSLVLRHAHTSPDLLDLGTGGGEWLAGLPFRPPGTVATEGWEPNIEVARSRLRPLGVTVVRAKGAPDNIEQQSDETRGRLPFPAESFHLVVDRHEAFVPSEIARVLVAGGRFITQQVGGNYDDFRRLLDLPVELRSREWDLSFAAAQLEAAGLRACGSDEGEQEISFTDVGAIVWYLKAVPWTLPEFSVTEHRARLAELHARITRENPAVVRLPAFYVEAMKPAVV